MVAVSLPRVSAGSVVARSVANTSGDFVHGLVAGLVLLTLFVAAATLSLVGVGLILLPPVLLLAHANARLTAYRLGAVLGTPIRVPAWGGDHQGIGWGRRWLLTVGSRRLWRDLLHGLVMTVVGPLWFLLSMLLWSLAAALLLFPLYAGAIPSDAWVSGLGWPLSSWTLRLGAVLLGVAVVVLAALFCMSTARLDVGLARRLLELSGSETLLTEVRELRASRTALVEAADAERRRIERDLHDGVQPHLVAMAMTLGQALRRFDTDPDTARRLVDEAHVESKSAMSELRNVVRGLHPAILTERGLDAAVSSLAARSPVPVTVDVRLRPGARLPVSIETVAYYVAAEGLTNVARHSAASHAALTVHDDGEELTVSVSDDGTGGASASPGSGLAGLNDRVIAVGGTLDVESGSSGTTLSARLPCAS